MGIFDKLSGKKKNEEHIEEWKNISPPHNLKGKRANYVYLWYDSNLSKTGGSVASIAEYIFKNNNVSKETGIEIHPVDESWFKDAFSMAIMEAAVDTQDYRKEKGITSSDFLQKLFAFVQDGLANNLKWYSLGLTIKIRNPDTKSLTNIREMEVKNKSNKFEGFLRDKL